LKGEIDFWNDLEARLGKEREKVEVLKELEVELGNEEPEEIQELLRETREHFETLKRRFEKEEIKVFLSGPYDGNAATLSIFAGAGGRDAEDWADMLLRMYVRYAERQRYSLKGLREHRGEEGGIRTATVEVDGRNVYGFLRHESGVHRLVRISPFDASKRRHTSFVLVEVLPVLKEIQASAIVIDPEDLEVETFRASGPGGQYVNRRESAVRVRHTPTGLVAECQAERLQGQNKDRALKMLAAKLAAREEEERRKDLAQIRGEKIAAEWGSQIRSYVLHPYKMVKDHRTGVEHPQPERVLDGDLDSFIHAEVRQFGERRGALSIPKG